MSKKTANEPKPLKQKCLNCHNHTNHAVLAKQDKTDGDDEVTWWTSYLIIQCQGCDSIYFRKESRFSEDIDYNFLGEPFRSTSVECYPPEEVRVDGLYLGDDVRSIPVIVQSIYRETISAIQKRHFTLAGIGVRAIVEAVCKDQNTPGESLFEQIDDLVTQSLLTASGAEILHGVRLLGNEAAHEMKAPTEKQTIAAMKVIDHLLLGAYVLPEEAKALPEYKAKAKKSSAKTTTSRSGTKAKGAAK